MTVKRCPSFSKRPGFPSGLRVLLVDADSAARSGAESLLKSCSYAVTPCSTTAEALQKLAASPKSYDVLLADKAMVSGRTRDRQQLLEACKELPCILMAADPQPNDIYQGIQLGAVDFLVKPLSPLKLRNIWQHTVRKMISSMNISCPTDAQDLVEQLQIPGQQQLDQQQQNALAAVEATAAAAAAMAAAAAAASESLVSDEAEETDAEMAALEEKVGHPGKQLVAACAAAVAATATSQPATSAMAASLPGSPALSRAGSLAAPAPSTNQVAPAAGLGLVLPAPASPASLPRSSTASPATVAVAGALKPLACLPSCPSTNSLRSCSTALAGVVPMATVAVPAASAASAEASCLLGPSSSAGSDGRTTPVPITATSAPAAATPSSSPAAACAARGGARGRKPARQVPPPSRPAAPKAATSAAGPGAAVAAPLAMPLGLGGVLLPTGLGPLPQGMVWGMPMCPLARAPGIVPPAGTAAAAGAAMPWGLTGPMMAPGALMGPGASLGPLAFMPAFNMMGMAVAMPAAAAAVPPMMAPAAAAVAAAPSAAPATGAAAAAALSASLSMDDGLLDGSGLQLMLGDVTAEDDLDEMIQDDLGLPVDGLPVSFSSLQELETTAKGLCTLQAPLSAAMDADLAAEAGKASAFAAAAAAAGGCEARKDAVSTALARMGSLASTRSSFESVTCSMGGHTAAVLSKLGKVDSFSDLFGAAAGSMGEGNTPGSSADGDMADVESCGMLAELETLFTLQAGDGQEQSSGDSLFEGLELPGSFAGVKKSDSFADILAQA